MATPLVQCVKGPALVDTISEVQSANVPPIWAECLKTPRNTGANSNQLLVIENRNGCKCVTADIGDIRTDQRNQFECEQFPITLDNSRNVPIKKSFIEFSDYVFGENTIEIHEFDLNEVKFNPKSQNLKKDKSENLKKDKSENLKKDKSENLKKDKSQNPKNDKSVIAKIEKSKSEAPLSESIKLRESLEPATGIIKPQGCGKSISDSDPTSECKSGKRAKGGCAASEESGQLLSRSKANCNYLNGTLGIEERKGNKDGMTEEIVLNDKKKNEVGDRVSLDNEYTEDIDIGPLPEMLPNCQGITDKTCKEGDDVNHQKSDPTIPKREDLPVSEIGTLTDSQPDEDNAYRDFESEETLIIFDWDDTLLPSSWMSENKLNLETPGSFSLENRQLLHLTSEAVCQLLKRAMSIGQVVIVTNAENGWVEMSAAKFIPAVASLISENHIKIVSARSKFESFSNPTPLSWKIEAFKEILHSYFPETVKENMVLKNSLLDCFSLTENHFDKSVRSNCRDMCGVLNGLRNELLLDKHRGKTDAFKRRLEGKPKQWLLRNPEYLAIDFESLINDEKEGMDIFKLETKMEIDRNDLMRDNAKKSLSTESISTAASESSPSHPMPRSRVNVISIGDSECERRALFTIMKRVALDQAEGSSDSISFIVYKSVKLFCHPNPISIHYELKLINNHLAMITHEKEIMDLVLEYRGDAIGDSVCLRFKKNGCLFV